MQRCGWQWVAGIFEGEGSVHFNGKNSVSLWVKMIDEDVVRRCAAVTGFGQVTGPFSRSARRQDIWHWQVSRSDHVATALGRFLPFLGARRRARAQHALT